MSEPTFQAVIWDMDGLLLDTERLSIDAWQIAARDMAVAIDVTAFQALIGRNPQGIRLKLVELLGTSVDIEELARRAGQRYQEIIGDGLPLKNGAKESIEFLARHAVPQAVATSSTMRVAARKLEHHDLLRHLNTLVTGDQVSEGKPHPEPYLLAAERLGIAPRNCLAFEDSVNGVLSADAAGMSVILIPDICEHGENTLKRVWKTFPSLTDAFPVLETIARATQSKRPEPPAQR